MCRAAQMPLSVVLGEVKPTTVTPMDDGSFLYFFPKNFVGTIRCGHTSHRILLPPFLPIGL